MRIDMLDILCCPSCHGKVTLNDNERSLNCDKCGIRYDLEHTTPIMLTPERKTNLRHDLDQWSEQEIIPKHLSYSTIQFLRSPAPFHWFGKKKDLRHILSKIDPNGIYLDIGGVGTIHPNVRTVNIAPSLDTDIVADGQHLPFHENSVDGIFILLVLEHVPHPEKIAREIERVLKPGAFVFATLPFLQVMHANPKDYYRFTPDGIRTLFDGFKEESLKIASGPSGTLVWVLKEYLALLCPFSNNSFIYVSVREVMGWCLFPLVLLDLYLNRKKRAAKMASFFAFLGTKKHNDESE